MSYVHVLHIAETLPGGPASYLEEVLPYQVGRLGADGVTLLAPDQHAKYVTQGFGGRLELYRRTGRNLASLARLAIAARKCIAQQQPDIVHLHCSFSGAVIRLLLKLRRQRPIIVYCAHGWSFSRTTGVISQRVCAAIERWLACNTDIIINLSKSDLDAATKFGLPREKMVIVRSGISGLVPQIKIPIVLDQRKINILFVGRHDPQKGLDLLLSAMKELVGVPIHLHVVGSAILADETGRDEVLTNVSFYGWVSRDQVSGYIAAADAVIMPSRWEGLPLTAIEAMRLSRPVIASNCGGLKDIVVDGETGILFPTNDIQAIVSALKALDPVKIRSMRSLASQRFMQDFTASRMNTELVDLYERLVRAS